MNIQKILVPIDYSGDSHQALQWGASLAEQYGAQIVLLHVIPKAVEEVYPHGIGWLPTPSFYYEGMASDKGPFREEPIIIDLEENARTQMREFAYKDLKEHVRVQVKVAVGEPAEEILRAAHEQGVHLIVMGTHGRTGLRHLLFGSVAEQVIRGAPCPVFTVRAGIAAA